MDFTQGDVVLIKFPFSDGKGFKKRPALILQTFEDGDLLFCRITSKFYQSVFDVVLQDWSDLGLLLPSVVRIHKIIVLESSLIDKKVGKISKSTFEKISKVISGILDVYEY